MSPAALPLSDLRTERPRTAVAEGRVRVGEAAFQMLADGTLKDRDVLTMAQVAGLLGAKQTSRLLPLCHDVALRGLDVTMRLDESDYAVVIRASAKAVGATGVTMEAMTAVSVAALTVFDAVRSTAADAEITGLHLVAKTGGASGDYVRSR
ncbi:MAG: cyclic pyranopterin monophosphate synthase MoaC [Bacteroidetes bacterium]|nr:cyclic pyranopterin monophosphate synthase MoaC [Bacteroidota bacterium]